MDYQHSPKLGSESQSNSDATDLNKYVEEETEADENTSRENHLGWKKIILLPFEPVWKFMILFIGYGGAIILLLNETQSFSEQKENTNIDMYGMRLMFDFMYFVDNMLAIASKIFPDLNVPAIYAKRPNWIIVLELISSIPLEIIMLPITKGIVYFRLLGMSDLLRLPRCMFYFYYHRKMVGNKKVVLLFIQCVFSSSILLLTTFYILYVTTCFGQDCDNYKTGENLETAFIAITNNGFYDFSHDKPQGLFIATCAALIAFFGITIPTVGELITVFTSNLSHKYTFMYRLQRIRMTAHAHKNNSNHLHGKVMKFYEVLWKHREGHGTKTSFLSILPPSIKMELATDISWYALKHSKIFQRMDLPFLRAIALVMNHKFATAGEYLYQKGKNKHKMIYVVSGIVQVISEEDGETPLISFSAGTCFGETSLIFNYDSTFSVVCKEYSELHVLEMKKYVSVTKNFPKQAKKLRKMIYNRLDEAKHLKRISMQSNLQHGISDKDKPTLMWINSTLHKLMRKNEKSSLHDYQNVFLREDFGKEMFDQMQFTAKNLDLLAITERIELVADTVFLKSSFPCVFRPNSVVLRVWDCFISLLAFFMGFMIPYYSLVEDDTPNWHIVLMKGITVIYWIDVYVQVSTAFRTKDELVISIRSIFVHRLENIDFIFDLMAAYPMEMYSCVIINRPHPQSFACLYLNRVLKIWKLKTVMEKYEGTSAHQVMAYNYLKYVFIYAYVIYITACIIFALNCFLGECISEFQGDNTMIKFSWAVFSATQLITGIALESTNFSYKSEFNVTYALLMYLALLIYVATLMEVSTIHTLLRLPRLKLQTVYLDIKSVMLAHKATHKFKRRTLNYLRTQWKHSEAQQLILKDHLLQELPMQIYGAIKENAFSNIIKGMQLFQDLSDDVVYEICLICEVKIFPPKTVLAYAGEVDKIFYLILAGQCEVISSVTRAREATIGQKDAISLMEVCARTRNISTVITLTHARVLAFNIDQLKGAFTRYPGELETFHEVLSTFKLQDTLENSLHRVWKEMHYVFDLEYDEDNTQSFHNIGYNLQMDSEEEFDYYIPFDRLGMFSFIRLFLMRRTAMPFGKFIFVWEGFRSFFALLSSLFYVINPITTCTGCFWKYLLFFLDLTAWCDIYLRFHVGYYNTDGILVTHPLKTAHHYLQRGFLLDLLSVFPIHIFFKFETVYDNKIYTLLHSNRLLQLVRFWGYFTLFDKEYIQPSKVIAVFRHFPQVLVVCNVLAAIISNIDCDFHSDIEATEKYDTGVICSPSSFYSLFNFTKPYHPLDVHLLSLYFASSAVTMAGMQGFTFNNLSDSAFEAVCSFLGTFIQMYIIGSVNAIYSVKSSSLRQYQEEMKAVKEYFKRNRAATGAYHALMKHFEVNWRKKRGKDIHQITKQFDKSLYQDLLYHVYGKTLTQYSIFRDGSEPFFRVLLPETVHEAVTNGTQVISISDVKTRLHMIVNGCFDVIAPDESKLTTLGVGSIFGNLDDYSHLRQTLGYVASGHSEIISVKALTFHNILKKFPKLNTQFKDLTAIHVDFIAGRKAPVRTDDAGDSQSGDLTKSTMFQAILGHIFHPESRGITIWKVFVLIVVCYIAPMLSVYTMSFNFFCTPCLVFEYLCDILFAVDFYLYYHTAYENDIGVLIKDKTLIRRRVNKERLHVVFSIMCMIPYDLFVWTLPLKFSIRGSVLEWFRITKIYRLVTIYKYFSQQDRRLNVNMLFMRGLYLLFMISLLLHFFTCVSVVVGCLGNETMYPPIKCEYLHYAYDDRGKKFRLYTEQFYIIIMCFVKCSQSGFYPVSGITTSFYTFYMIVNVIFTSLILTNILIITKMPWRLQGKYERNIAQILHYMETESASTMIMNRVWMYVRLLWKRQKGSNYPLLIDTAPANLKAIVLNKCFAHHIYKNLVLGKCHEDFIRQLVPCLESYTYFQGDYIVFKGTVDDCMYFIHEGEITVHSEDSLYKEDVVGTLVVGQSFGILQGLKALLPHAYSFRSSSTSIVLTLNRKKWGMLLNFFPASRETIYEAANCYTGF